MPHLLLILDGYGIAVDSSVSAVDAAQTPYLDSLMARYPHGTLQASERAVGLPVGQMGNSEVGHTNLGAGRVVHQDIVRIDVSIEDDSFYSNSALVEAAGHVKQTGGKLHLLGLFSDGGVHSHLDHLYALLRMAERNGIGDRTMVHAFTDGRDTAPDGAGSRYIREAEAQMHAIGAGKIADVVGRYYAMDRDERWERVERAYRLLVDGEGDAFPSAQDAVDAAYRDDLTDEFITPRRIAQVDGTIQSGDAVIWYNFRTDRARELTRALVSPDFDGFERGELLQNLYVATFATYDQAFDLPVAFPKDNLVDTLGEVVAAAGLTQLRAAETEKYPHVTYFFSGGREEPFVGEDRIMVPSPKVATYDLQPEMSVGPLADQVAQAIRANDYALAVVNFANPDMVGHTGVFEAAVAAIESCDQAARVVVEAALEKGYSVTILADHGNSDKMRNPDGSPHTAHTTALVPHLIIADGVTQAPQAGKLGDVAPTILHLLGLPIPAKMTGDVLV